MAISEDKTQVYATIPKVDKVKLLKLAKKYKRSLSQEIAYALSLYLESEEENLED